MRDNGGLQLRGGFGRLVDAIIAALVVLIALTASALGQTNTQPAPAPIQRSHPARKPFRAARLTYLTGSVTVEQANSKTQEVAVVNMPLVEGTVLTTGDDGQAEIEFEDGSVVRVTPNSGVSLLNLSVDGSGNYQTRISVLGGLVYAELRAGTKYQYSLDAGGSVVSPSENATFRVNLDEPPAQIAVVQGVVHLASANTPSGIDAQAGQTARADAEQQGAPFVVTEQIAPETWDQWNEDRDQAAASESGTQTAARDQFAGDQGYGWSDLDANGSWYNIPGQGQVWQPSEADDATADASGQDQSDPNSGFDPYGYGSWVWTPAGYSWASGYGWGWLPYRCGTWGYFGGFGWGWQPGSACGEFGFGGYGFGGYGLGINIGHGPSGWRHPRRPIPGPGPVHPIVHGPVTNFPVAVAKTYGEGRLVRIKTVNGRSIEPLPPVANVSALRGSEAVGSALKRDYPVSGADHEAVLGIVPTHTAPPSTGNGGTDRQAWQSGQGYAPGNRQAPGRSTIVPAWPNYGSQMRSAPVPAPRPRSAPAPRPSSPPASSGSHSAPSSSASPHK